MVKARIKEHVQHVGLTISHSAIVQQGWDWLLVLVHEFDRMPLGALGLAIACGNNSALHNEA